MNEVGVLRKARPSGALRKQIKPAYKKLHSMVIPKQNKIVCRTMCVCAAHRNSNTKTTEVMACKVSQRSRALYPVAGTRKVGAFKRNTTVLSSTQARSLGAS